MRAPLLHIRARAICIPPIGGISTSHQLNPARFGDLVELGASITPEHLATLLLIIIVVSCRRLSRVFRLAALWLAPPPSCALASRACAITL